MRLKRKKKAKKWARVAHTIHDLYMHSLFYYRDPLERFVIHP